MQQSTIQGSFNTYQGLSRQIVVFKSMKPLSFHNLLLAILCVVVLAQQLEDAQFNTQKLLERLRGAQGDRKSITIIEILVKIKDGESDSSGTSPVEGVIQSIEEIVVVSKPLHGRTRFLNGVREQTRELSILNGLLHSRLDGLSKKSRFLYGSSLSQIAFKYIKHQKRTLQNFKLRLFKSSLKVQDIEKQVNECLSECKIALETTLVSLHLMQSKDLVVVNKILRAAFQRNSQRNSKNRLHNLKVSTSAQRDRASLEADIKYLRETFIVIVKSGMFMFFCLAFQIYICSFTFGVLLTISSLLWISIFLQLSDL